MKHIRFRILLIVWVSVILLFLTFAYILNIVLPSHFEKEAENALNYEIDYINYMKLESSNDDDKPIDEESSEGQLIKEFENGYEGTYFSSDIYYLDISDCNEENSEKIIGSTSNANTNNELIEYEKNHEIESEIIYTYQTENGYYIFTEVVENNVADDNYFELSEQTPQKTIMYVNINHIVQYTKSLNWLILAIFICILIVMSIIGYRLGVQIENSQKTQQRFFQNSSHELKTPLMAIQGYAEGIEMDVVDSQNAASIIMQETDRMTALVEEILSISKIDAHHFKLEPVKLDIREVLYDCFRSLDAVQQMNDVDIVPQFPDEVIYVKCDENQLARAFRNIMINGLKYCKKKIIVTCESDGKNVFIRFKDDGNGIDREDIGHIFDRFYKGNNGGTGIGLSLAKEIILLHKGSITAYNYLDGAAFEIKLPLAK